MLLGCASVPESEAPWRHEPEGPSWRVERGDSARLEYLVTVPAGYHSGKAAGERFPVIVFLHSLAERGLDPSLLIDNPAGMGRGIAFYALADRSFPFVTISPRCPRRRYWPGLTRRLDTLLDELLVTYAIDPKAVFLTGTSMGGMGVWSWSMASAELFAAAAPVAGGIYPPLMREDVEAIVDLPIWAFHDRRDPEIPIEREAPTIEKLRAAGAPVRYTVTDEGVHYLHEQAFGGGELFEWFLAQIDRAD